MIIDEIEIIEVSLYNCAYSLSLSQMVNLLEVHKGDQVA